MLLFDLETEGIHPDEGDRIRCFAAKDFESGDTVLRLAGPSGERQLIVDLIKLLRSAPVICGWNIEEFDLPFIHERAKAHQINFPVIERKERGKYGDRRFIVPFAEARDIAYEMESFAVSLGAGWHLQMLAQALGWQGSTELEGVDMPGAPAAQVAAHCLDDLDAITFLLRERDARLVEEQGDYLLGHLD